MRYLVDKLKSFLLLTRSRKSKEIANSIVFDSSYYVLNNPDVEKAHLDPFDHYQRYGAAEARKPHPLFDTAYYVKELGGNVQNKDNPLVNYMTTPENYLFSPHPLFDGTYYSYQAGLLGVERHINPLVHYLEEVATERPSPHPLFDKEYFSSQVKNHPLFREEEDVLISYLTVPEFWGISPHPLFDTTFYLDQIKGKEPGMPLVEHYLVAGSDAGLDPHPLFDGKWYRRQFLSTTEEIVNPLQDYILRGNLLGYEPIEMGSRRQQPLVMMIVCVFDINHRSLIQKWLTKVNRLLSQKVHVVCYLRTSEGELVDSTDDLSGEYVHISPVSDVNMYLSLQDIVYQYKISHLFFFDGIVKLHDNFFEVLSSYFSCIDGDYLICPGRGFEITSSEQKQQALPVVADTSSPRVFVVTSECLMKYLNSVEDARSVAWAAGFSDNLLEIMKGALLPYVLYSTEPNALQIDGDEDKHRVKTLSYCSIEDADDMVNPLLNFDIVLFDFERSGLENDRLGVAVGNFSNTCSNIILLDGDQSETRGSEDVLKDMGVTVLISKKERRSEQLNDAIATTKNEWVLLIDLNEEPIGHEYIYGLSASLGMIRFEIAGTMQRSKISIDSIGSHPKDTNLSYFNDGNSGRFSDNERDERQHYCERTRAVGLHGMFIKKRLFTDLRGFNELYCNDYYEVDFCMRAQEEGKIVYNLPHISSRSERESYYSRDLLDEALFIELSKRHETNRLMNRSCLYDLRPFQEKKRVDVIGQPGV